MPGKWNPRIFQGATFAAELIYTDDAGVAIDLSGYAATLELQNNRTGAVSTYIPVITPLEGKIEVLVTATQTAAMDPRATYELQLDLTAGALVVRLLRGTATVTADVTP